jgi:AraC-like DNA-binding protein
MSILLRPDSTSPVQRAEYWDDVLAESICPVEVRTGGDLHVPEQLVLHEAGPVLVSDVSIRGSGEAIRSWRHVRTSDPDFCKIDLMVDGSGIVEQDDRQASLNAGDLAVVDVRRPARWAVSAHRVIGFMFPRALLPLGADDLGDLTAVSIRGDHGAGLLISTLARQLVDQAESSTPAELARMATALLDLLGVGLAARLAKPETVPAETYQQALLVRLHAFIEEQLPDPELSPASIASAHHISLRYLYKLFEAEGSAVADWIRQRRLERCRHDLLEPCWRATPVSAIGARWGLPNAAHFSRAFRHAYGVSPVEYRRMSQDLATTSAA